MTEGSEHTKRGEAKGFAGLSSLASDVDAILTPPKNLGPQNRTEPASSPARPVPTPVQSPQRSKPAQAYQAPPRSPSGSSGMKWLLGIAAVVGVIWYSNASSQKPSSSIPAYTPPTQETSTSYTPPSPEPVQPWEERPPVGQSLVLTTTQITYCLAEDIRLEGAKAVIDSYSDSQVDRFNVWVDDYNSRCGSFRYRSGALESARRAVEPYRSQLLADGRSRF